MLKNNFTRPNRRFSCALIGLGILAFAAMGLMAVVVIQLRADKQALLNMRQTFAEQKALWRTQNIIDYSISYTQCSSNLCCQGATLAVRDGSYFGITPNCAPPNQTNMSAFYGYQRIASVSEAYIWLSEWMAFNETRRVSISYHPNLHYMTEVRFTPWQGADEIVIGYADLQVQ